MLSEKLKEKSAEKSTCVDPKLRRASAGAGMTDEELEKNYDEENGLLIEELVLV